ncbi:MAG: hypothetical protein ORN29_07270 [Rhodoferax sp.]|nr:hypothetical protein [Rhodoferax sp.]
MKKKFAPLVPIALAALVVVGTGFSTRAQAQEVYAGLGFPGLYSLGYAHQFVPAFGVRAEYATGLSFGLGGNQQGVSSSGSFKATRFGAFADWFPFEGNFRLVGGLTFNDIKGNISGASTGTFTINQYQLELLNENFSAGIKFPETSPYVGFGFGHQQSENKGLGFFADVGLMVGSFTVSANTSLVGKRVIAGQQIQFLQQSDVDAELKKINNTLGYISVLPSLSLGLLYRF